MAHPAHNRMLNDYDMEALMGSNLYADLRHNTVIADPKSVAADQTPMHEYLHQRCAGLYYVGPALGLGERVLCFELWCDMMGFCNQYTNYLRMDAPEFPEPVPPSDAYL